MSTAEARRSGATSAEQEITFWTAGNAVGPWRFSILGAGHKENASGGNVLSTLPLLQQVHLVDHDDFWLSSGQKYRMTFDGSGATIHHRATMLGTFAATHDALEFFGNLSNEQMGAEYDTSNPSPFLLGLLQETIKYDTVDVDIPIGKQGAFRGSLRLSLVAPAHFQRLEAVGAGVLDPDDGAVFYLDYVYHEGDGGIGWAMGGEIAYETPRYILNVTAFDVIGEITWSDVRVRAGFVNNRTIVRGPDGYLYHAPLAYGTKSIERWLSRPKTHWTATFIPKEEKRLTRLHFSYSEPNRLNLAAQFRITSILGLTIGVGMPYFTPEIGMDYKTWSIAVSATDLDLASSPVVGLRISKMW